MFRRFCAFLLAGLIWLPGCTSAQPKLLSGVYTDGEVSVQLDVETKSWSTNFLDESLPYDPGELKFIDVNQQEHSGKREGEVIVVSLLGKQRSLRPETKSTKHINKAVMQASYRLGGTSSKLLLRTDYSFDLFGGTVSGVWFTTDNSGILLISDQGNSLEQFYFKDDIIFGLACEGSLALVQKRDDSLAGCSLSGETKGMDGTVFVFNDDGKVLVNNTEFSYTVDADGVVAICSIVDGMRSDYVYVDNTGNVFRAVFLKEAITNPALEVSSIVGLTGDGSLESLSAQIDGSSNLAALYITAALPAVTVSEEQKLKLLQEYQTASAKEENRETIEISNFRDVVAQSMETSVPSEQLDQRVIAEVGEEYMAPTNDNGEAIITLDGLASAESK